MRLLMRSTGAVALLALTAAVPGDAALFAQAEPRVVKIAAERFQFSPSEIKLQVGDVVELRLTSDDTIHGFKIVGTETTLAIPKRGGGEVSMIFKAEKAGRFAFECDRMCGAGHHFMRGVIIVRERAKGAGR